MRTANDVYRISDSLEYRLGSISAYLYMLGTDEEESITLDDAWNFLQGIQYICEQLVNLNENSTEADIQYHFYEGAKIAYGDDKGEIRRFFKYLYRLVLGQDSGSRWGQFVSILGVENFINQLRLPQPF